jgi:thiol:disulfide interchange protein DsbC
VKIFFYVVAGCLIMLVPFSAHAFKLQEGQDCLTCHKLKKAEAQDIVERVAPGYQVVDIKSSPVKGAWQIDVQKGEQHGAVHLDFSKKYLVGFQPVPQKVAFSKIPLGDAIIMGQATAKKKLIVFTDPDCPYCKELHKVMHQILAKRDDIVFYLILNPLPMHPEAFKKSQTILCTKSLAILNDAFSGKEVPEPTCSADAVERDKALAKSLNFISTPTIVRQDGVVLSGFLPEGEFLNWIDKKQPRLQQ